MVERQFALQPVASFPKVVANSQRFPVCKREACPHLQNVKRFQSRDREGVVERR
jgi:hypothetical protein